MQKKKGITLIALIVTVVMLIILASVTTIEGLESLYEARRVEFVTEMKIIQSRVDYIYEKINQGTGDEFLNKGTPVTESLSNYSKIKSIIDTVNAICEETGEPQKTATDFQYFTSDLLEEIGIEDVKEDVIINFSTRDVISTIGIKVDNIMYYRLFDMRRR